MKRASQYALGAALAALCAVAVSGARTPAFAEETRACYNGTPQECFRNEICTQYGWSITLYPPSFGQTCLTKSIEIYYWTASTTTSGSTGTVKPPSTTLK